MTYTIALIPGDGIGLEVIPAARLVLESLDLPLVFVEGAAGFATFAQTGSALPPETLTLCESSDAILFGATQSPLGRVAGYQSPILRLRQHFNLYANLRPAESGVIDMLIVRENTEGLYSRRERTEDDGQTAIAERVITAAASERIVRVACEQALKRRGRLTIVHKANVLKETCGLFRDVALRIVQDYPLLTVDEQLVDACAMRMVQDPEPFDVLVTTNLFGDILSDLAAGLTGGLGLAPSANLGDDVSLFEPIHGSAPDIAGTQTADPRAAILSAGLLLETLGYQEEAIRLRLAVMAVAHTGHTPATAAAVIEQMAGTR